MKHCIILSNILDLDNSSSFYVEGGQVCIGVKIKFIEVCGWNTYKGIYTVFDIDILGMYGHLWNISDKKIKEKYVCAWWHLWKRKRIDSLFHRDIVQEKKNKYGQVW